MYVVYTVIIYQVITYLHLKSILFKIYLADRRMKDEAIEKINLFGEIILESWLFF